MAIRRLFACSATLTGSPTVTQPQSFKVFCRVTGYPEVIFENSDYTHDQPSLSVVGETVISQQLSACC
jgi:hypothetical protein